MKVGGSKGGKSIAEVKSTRKRKVKVEPVRSKRRTHTGAPEDVLQNGEHKFRSVFENANDMVVFVDTTGTVTEINERVRDVIGYDPEEIVGKKLTRPGLLSAENASAIKELFAELVKRRRLAGRRRVIEVAFKHRDGRTVIAEVSAATIKENGQLKGLLSVVRDITDRRKAEQALRESEEKYRELFENAQEAVVTMDLKGNITDANKFVEQYGFRRQWLIGKSHFDFIAPGYKARSRRDFRRLVRGEPMEGYLEITTPKGNVRVAYKDRPIKRAGKVVAIQGIMSDITEQKLTEAALKDSEQRFRVTFERAASGIAHTSLDGRFLRVNDRYCEIVGYSREELLKKTFQAITHPDDLASGLQRHRRLLAGGIETYSMEKRYVRTDGSIVWAGVTVSAAREDGGGPNYLISVIQDVTGRKRAEALERLQLELAVELSGTTDLDKGIRLCLERAIEASDMDCGGVYLVDESTAALELVCHKGLSPEFVGVVSRYEASSANARLVMQGRPIYADHNNLSVPLSKPQISEGLRAIAVLPMLNEGKVIGCMNIASHRLEVVPDDSRWVLETIAAEAGGTVARLETEDALRRAERERATILETISELVVYQDMEHRVVWANRAAGDSVGQSEGDLVGRYCYEVWHGRSTPCENCPVEGAHVTGWPEAGEMSSPDGRVWAIRCYPVRDEAGQLQGIVEVTRDISERKLAERALKRNENVLRTVINATREAMISIDERGVIVLFNPAAEQMFGRKREEMAGKPLDCLMPQEYRRRHREYVKRYFATGKPNGVIGRILELSGRRSNGEVFPMAISLSAGKIDGERFVIAVARDITERKRAEHLLRWERDRAQQYLDVAGVMMVAIDVEGRVGLINKKGCEVLGYAEDEILGRNWFDNFLPERIRQETKGVFEGLVKGDVGAVEYHESVVLTKTGEEKLIAWHNTILSNERGEVIAALSSGTDVTERRRAEELLRSRKEILQTILDNIPVMTAFLDAQGRHKWVNQAWEKTLGWSLQEAQSRDVLKEFYPDPRYRRYAVDFITKAESRWGDFKTRRRDGTVLDTTWTNVPVSDGSNIGIGLDITERKRAEEALRESQERFREIFENSVVGIYRTTPDGRILAANPALVRMLGYESFEELAARNLEQNGFSGGYSRSEFKERVEAGGQITGLESMWKRRDGSTLFVRESARVIRDDYGKTLYYEGTVEDVTQQKRAEEALRQREATLQSVFRAAPVGMGLIMPRRIIVHVNDRLCEMTGYSRDELVGRNSRVLYPSDREYENVGRVKYGQLHEKGIGTLETRWRCRGGEVIDVVLSSSALDPADVSKGITFTALDVTERKRAEEALRASEENYRAIFNTVNDAIFVHDMETGGILDVNEKMCDMYGCTVEEARGYRIEDVSAGRPPYTQQEAMQWVARACEGRPQLLEWLAKNKAGRLFWVEVNLRRATIGGKDRLLAIVRDISDRKKTEAALRESEEQFRNLFESANDSLIYLDLTGRILNANDKAEDVLGVPRADLLGKHFREIDIFPPGEMPKLIHEFQEVIAGRRVVVTITIKNRRNEIIVLECSGNLITIGDKPSGVLLLARDITERRKAEDVIRRLAKFPAEDPNPVMRISGYGTILYGNDASRVLFEAWGCKVGESLPGRWHEVVLDALSSGEGQQAEVKCDGRVFTLIFAPVVGANYVNIYGLEITERKRAEQRLREYQGQLKSLASELTLTEERERRRIAVSLHDSISQILAVSKIRLEGLRHSVSPDDTAVVLTDVCESLAQAIKDARILISDLSSPILHELGFEAAVAAWLSQEVEQKCGIETELNDDKQAKPLDNDIAALLFRDVRELLINVVKHAEAKKVKVYIRRLGSQIEIVVEDDGIGFDVAVEAGAVGKRVGFGLFSIRERLEQLGGRFEIRSTPGEGCRVTMRVPLKKG